ncbi:hypothetical protein AU468_07790 [Alkalispirochaeta sphaeroplastigenens]|uniref:Permease n=1 Tax=Alkalispirochaeta sphaeroplastigenens TaxID=1187066 RepID=A0A2S4JQ23_9SPIO|nr:AI-2E family transporter [Alkalispirochaeta sphaeroplastigenens]POR01634.1 hypothetical protein AU468_07790 [Alkalispirochaeta sphaeroplastigenens]
MKKFDNLLPEIIFLLILVAFSLAFFRLMTPFLLSAFLAVVLANLFWPVFTRISRRLGKPRLAAAITTVIIILIVIIPAGIITALVAAEVIELVGIFRRQWGETPVTELLTTLQEHLAALPLIRSVLAYLPEDEVTRAFEETFRASGDHLLRMARRYLGSVSTGLFKFLITILLTFFFILDGPRIVQRIKEFLPLSDHNIDQITSEMVNTISATLTSTVFLGILEGAMTTILFLSLGLPSPFLWGVVTMVLSMIPLVGTNLILLPAGIISLLLGRPVAGIIIICVGAGTVGINQNIIRPKLVGNRTGLHPALALLSTIGGLAHLGLIGFLVGPVTASLFIVTWRQFGKRYERILAEKNTPLF